MGEVDARALLRAERLTRRITHPQASYTKDSKLLCNLCELPIKSENAWKAHLHSTGHVLRLSRLHNVDVTRGNGSEHSGAKKRKADSLDSPVREERKKAKATNEDELADTTQVQSVSSKVTVPIVEPAVAVIATDQSLDDEYAAFERDIARLDSTSVAPSALDSTATISAAPMSAAEIAAQAREQQSAQRDTRDAEAEGEREDAARLMADELDEMDGLEERMKKLRDRREALRSGRGEGVTRNVSHENVDSVDGTLERSNDHEFDDGKDGKDDDDDEDEDEDFDDWKFGGG